MYTTSAMQTAKYLQGAYFTHGDPMNSWILLGFGEFLDGDHLTGLTISALEDDAIGSLANPRQSLVPLHKVWTP